jgi:hypothetical protein
MSKCQHLNGKRNFSKRPRRRIGPHSDDLVLGSLDLRTNEGRFIAGIRQSLLDQLGREPSAAEQLMVSNAAIKALRCELMLQRIFKKDSLDTSHDLQFLAWSNSMRRDLEALGIKPNAVQAPDLRQYLIERKKVAAE